MLEKIRSSAKNLTTTRGLVLSAMLLAVYGVIGIWKIPLPPAALENRITFTFAATSAAGIVLGPVPAALVGALGDIIGYMLNPGGGAFFPGFTVSAALGGCIYGACLYKRSEKTAIFWIIAAVFLVTVFVNMILNTFWLGVLYQKAYSIFALTRIIKNLIAFPVHVVVIYALFITCERTGIRKKYQ